MCYYAGRLLPVHLPQPPVQLELALRQQGQFGEVTASLRIRDLHSQIAERAFKLPLLQTRNRPLNGIGPRRFGFGQERLGKQGPLPRILYSAPSGPLRLAGTRPAGPQTRQVPQIEPVDG